MFDTIAAIATGNTVSAIGIIRISGEASIKSVEATFKPSDGRLLSTHTDRTLIYGDFLDKNGAVIDKCLCTVSHAPNSYTGENTAELHCHGSRVVLRLVLERLFDLGVRQALPGEFTKRAFINGKLDLIGAEAVIDLIEAETEEIAKNAAGQLDGVIYRKIDLIYGQLVDIMSHYHAALDYPDEEIESFSINEYAAVFENAVSSIEALAATYARGSVMKSGVKTVILGKPNAGKSTLLNTLLGFDRAIVTPTAGTTRDTIEECAIVNGVRLRLIDTAGLRTAQDDVERIGIDRAIAAASAADLALLLIDSATVQNVDDTQAYLAAASAKHIILVATKIDLAQNPIKPIYPENSRPPDSIVYISSITGEGIGELEAAISALFPAINAPPGEIVTSSRQYDALRRAADVLNGVIALTQQGSTPDIILTELEAALDALGELSGKTVREDVVARIFEKFCVGK